MVLLMVLCGIGGGVSGVEAEELRMVNVELRMEEMGKKLYIL